MPQPPAPNDPQREPDPRFRLDPACMPRQLHLTLPPELAEYLEERAARSGRTLEDLIVEALDRSIGLSRDGREGGGSDRAAGHG